MNSFLDVVLFIAIMALLYLGLFSQYGIFARRLRDKQAKRKQVVRDMESYSESKHTRSTPVGERQSELPSRTPDR